MVARVCRYAFFCKWVMLTPARESVAQFLQPGYPQVGCGSLEFLPLPRWSFWLSSSSASSFWRLKSGMVEWWGRKATMKRLIWYNSMMLDVSRNSMAFCVAFVWSRTVFHCFILFLHVKPPHLHVVSNWIWHGWHLHPPWNFSYETGGVIYSYKLFFL